MKDRQDKIFDILSILDVMQELSTNFYNKRKLRISSVKQVAERELLKGRYKNWDSAYRTLIDACRRRLEPDVYGIDAFDMLAAKWMERNSHALKKILLKNSKNDYQKDAVLDFFKSH